MKQRVKFISYDGAYPNLCSGVLRFSIDGIEYCVDHILNTGSPPISFFEDSLEKSVGKKEWSIYFDEGDFKDIPITEDDKIVLTKLVNDHVPHGCCGGCL